ncbi:MAG: IS66 family insertion sequence element accessory protein TnpB [Spirochaetes bacterium]|nr:IS66 family insertion sequence element accessory protein TnpB [Spirochaetota bacterium]
MRKQINGLAELVVQEMGWQPFSGDIFLFCGRDMTMIKGLYWDRHGFCLWTKRIERGSFPWPRQSEGSDQAVVLSQSELAMILDGIDFRKRFKSIEYSRIA